DVEVLGTEAQQQVAHRAADDEGEVSGALQVLARAPRAAADVLALDRVPVLRVDDRARVLVRHALAPAEEAIDVFLDHERSETTCQPRSAACARSVASGSTATGCVTRSSSGRSFNESL